MKSIFKKMIFAKKYNFYFKNFNLLKKFKKKHEISSKLKQIHFLKKIY